MLRLASLAGVFALGLLLGGLPGGGVAGQGAAGVDQVLQADRDFDAAAARDGLEGWMSFMTADAARMPEFGGQLVSGAAEIRALDGPLLDSEELQLRWSPVHGHVFGDGELGVTTGTYEVRRRADATVAGTGHYLTLWRRTADGWRVAFDTGVASAGR